MYIHVFYLTIFLKVVMWNDQDSGQTFTDFMSSGSDYILSDNSSFSSSSDNDSEITLKCVAPQLNEITNITINNNFDFEKSNDQNYNCSSEHLVSPENASKQKINPKGLKFKPNEENQMSFLSSNRK